MLALGSTALDLALEDTAGHPVDLAGFRGTHAVLLYFLRSVHCPVCAGHVRALAGQTATLDRAGSGC